MISLRRPPRAAQLAAVGREPLEHTDADEAVGEVERGLRPEQTAGRLRVDETGEEAEPGQQKRRG